MNQTQSQQPAQVTQPTANAFDFMNTTPSQTQANNTDPAKTQEAPKEEKYVPNLKNKDDAWVKGAQFIDLVNLGKKEEQKPKAAPVYINMPKNTASQP